MNTQLYLGNIVAEPKGEASNRDALSFLCGYVCMYIHRLRNAILCLCMYIRNACTIQFHARVCMSVMLCTIEWPKCAPGDNYGPGLLPGLCGLFLMEEHNHKCFKSLPRSLRMAYDFRNDLKIHVNVCRVCYPSNEQGRGREEWREETK